jgi:hypothetical protein
MRTRPPKASTGNIDTRKKFASYSSKGDPIDKAKKIKVKHVVGDRIKDNNDPGVIAADMPNEAMEARVAFCCYQCFCPEEVKQQIPDDDPFIQTSEDGLYHRRCCHNVIGQHDEDWKTPFEHALDNAELKVEICHDILTINELQQQYTIANRHHNALYNADGLPGTNVNVGLKFCHFVFQF